MKKAVLTAIIMLSGVSAMAQYYPAPPPPPPGPVYYPGNGGYHGGGGYGRTQQDDQMSAMSAVTAAMFASLAISCASGPGCAYKQVIAQSKEDAALYMADGSRTALLTKAFELMNEKMKATDEQKAELILNFKAE